MDAVTWSAAGGFDMPSRLPRRHRLLAVGAPVPLLNRRCSAVTCPSSREERAMTEDEAKKLLEAIGLIELRLDDMGG